MADRCKVTIVPDDTLGFKLIIKGCEKQLEQIRKTSQPFTQRWVDEHSEYHDWSEDDEE